MVPKKQVSNETMSSGSSPHHPSETGAFRPPPCKRKKLDEPNILEEQNQEQDEVTVLSRTLTRSGSSDYQRSDIEVSNIMKQWRHFRSDQRFTDLTVFCGPKGTKVKTTKLHRLILASCSEFLSELLREREEAVLILPDCDPADFLNLVEILYGERVFSHDTGYPSADLLQLLRITSFPLLDKGTPYADSGTESADAELGSLFQGQVHEDLFLNQNIEEALGTLNFEDSNLNLTDVMREETLLPANTSLPANGANESNGPNRSTSNQSLNTMGFSPNAFQSDSFSPSRKPSDSLPVPVSVPETASEPPLVANPFSIAPPTPFMDRQAEQTNLPISNRKRDGRPMGRGKPSSYVKSLQGDDSQSLPGATDWSDNESVCSDWSDNDDTLGWTDDEGGLSGKSGNRRNRSASSGRGVRSKSRESRSAARPQELRQSRKTSEPVASIVPSAPEVIIDLSGDDPPPSSQTNGEAEVGHGTMSEGGYDSDMNDVNILESSDMEFQLRLSVSSASVGSRELRDCSNSLPSLPSRSSSVGSDLNDTFGDDEIISLPSQEMDVISLSSSKCSRSSKKSVASIASYSAPNLALLQSFKSKKAPSTVTEGTKSDQMASSDTLSAVQQSMTLPIPTQQQEQQQQQLYQQQKEKLQKQQIQQQQQQQQKQQQHQQPPPTRPSVPSSPTTTTCTKRPSSTTSSNDPVSKTHKPSTSSTVERPSKLAKSSKPPKSAEVRKSSPTVINSSESKPTKPDDANKKGKLTKTSTSVPKSTPKNALKPSPDPSPKPSPKVSPKNSPKAGASSNSKTYHNSDLFSKVLDQNSKVTLEKLKDKPSKNLQPVKKKDPPSHPSRTASPIIKKTELVKTRPEMSKSNGTASKPVKGPTKLRARSLSSSSSSSSSSSGSSSSGSSSSSSGSSSSTSSSSSSSSSSSTCSSRSKGNKKVVIPVKRQDNLAKSKALKAKKRRLSDSMSDSD